MEAARTVPDVAIAGCAPSCSPNSWSCARHHGRPMRLRQNVTVVVLGRGVCVPRQTKSDSTRTCLSSRWNQTCVRILPCTGA